MIASLAENAACRQCGYLLRDLHEPRCPECGAEFDPADENTFDLAGLSRVGRWLRRRELRRSGIRWWSPWNGPVRRVDAVLVIAAALIAIYCSSVPFCGCHGMPLGLLLMIPLLVAATTLVIIPRWPNRLLGALLVGCLLLLVRIMWDRWEADFKVQWFFFLIELLLVGAAAELPFRFLVRRHIRKVGYPNARQEGHMQRRMRRVMTVLVLLALPLPFVPWSLSLRLRASEAALTGAAQDVTTAGRGSLVPRRIGLYHVRAIRLLPSGPVLFQMDVSPGWRPYIWSYSGLIYVPDPPDDRWSRIWFTGSNHWYIGCVG